MIDKARFNEKCLTYGIKLTDEQINLLDRYAEILVEYNEKVNLTAITDAEGIENKHFIDSLLFAQNELVQGSLVDVGTGAGFPGIVTKIYKPDIDLTLMEPTGKRCVFLQYALDTLGLKGKVVKERAEEARRKQYREAFDVATRRAVADMRMLSEYCLPLVKQGGYFIAMKGDSEKELASRINAVTKVGGVYVKTDKFTLPDTSARDIITIKKANPTPKQYPRNGGNIAKKPL